MNIFWDHLRTVVIKSLLNARDFTVLFAYPLCLMLHIVFQNRKEPLKL